VRNSQLFIVSKRKSTAYVDVTNGKDADEGGDSGRSSSTFIGGNPGGKNLRIGVE
jgi:hypothetical protein